ncbi:MAG TPA: serine--tRNA ligase [Planctomycetota bacterium]|nr:serine--tRNA ligase [Planctomycetota bacterium]
MLDLDFIRKNPDIVKKAIQDKGDSVDMDKVLELDKERRQIITNIDNMRSQRKKSSEEIAKLKKEKKDADELVKQMKAVGDEISALETKSQAIEKSFTELISFIPNIPAADVPVGKGEADNVEVRHWGPPDHPVVRAGEHRKYDFTPATHWDIGQKLGIIQSERASKISGSGFILLSGQGARLERALINFMLDMHIKQHGFTEIMPPFLVNRQTMYATGQLPKLEADMYKTAEEDMFLIPTAEVPLTNIWRDEVIPEDKLPLYYVAATPCFRREAGSYGKDTRGIIRVHQFNKVEMVKFVHPDTSFDELEKLVRCAEAVLQALELEYRVVKLCTTEMSFSSATTYDLEAYAPGVGRYLEVSSCGNFTDFQARRGNIRFRGKDGKSRLVHTLNGSGVALPRTLITLLETHQQPDGSVIIPKALRPYMDGVERIG